MAGEDLYQSLGGISFAPTETPWGIGATTLAQSTPLMISPYASTGQALGIGLGSVLLQSLLGYQAQKEAAQQSLTANTIANQMLQESDAQKRLNLIQSLEPGYYQPAMQRKLLDVQSLITSRDAANKAAAAQVAANELAKLQAGGEFQLSPVGTEIFNREQAANLQKGLALAAANRQQREQQLPTGVQEKIVDASTFAEAAQAHRDKIASMSPAELKTLLTTGTSMFGLVGDPGFVSENEAVVQLYRKANFGATLTGQEKRAADIITGKSLTASKDDILAAWDTLINQSNKRAQRTIEVATKSPSTIGEMLTKPSGDEARKEQLRQQIAEIKALLAQRQK